jgi:hypothetical protein
MRVFLDNTCNDAEIFLQKYFQHSQKYQVIKKISCKNCLHDFSLLEEIVILDSFSCDTKRYVLSHLSDYMDFLFDENKCESLSSDNTITLLRSSDSMAIVSFFKRNDCQIILCVFSTNNKHQLDKKFERILDICTIKEQKVSDNSPFENGLSKEENEQIIIPILHRSIKSKSLSKEDKIILLEYVGSKRTEDFESYIQTMEAEKFDENKHRVASKIIGNHGAGGYGNYWERKPFKQTMELQSKKTKTR